MSGPNGELLPPPRRSDKRRVLNLIEEYKANDKFEKVLEAIEGQISVNTLNNWLKDKDGAERAYKSDALLRIKERLPSLEDLKKYDAYSFALGEMGLERDTQSELKLYHGIYNIYHRLESDQIETIAISSKSAPAFATFWFRYKSSGKTGICDGLVLTRRNRLYLMGLSKGAMFSANVRSVTDPNHDMLKGIAVFEDFNGEETSASKIVLVNANHRHTTEEELAISNYVAEDALASRAKVTPISRGITL